MKRQGPGPRDWPFGHGWYSCLFLYDSDPPGIRGETGFGEDWRWSRWKKGGERSHQGWYQGKRKEHHLGVGGRGARRVAVK